MKSAVKRPKCIRGGKQEQLRVEFDGRLLTAKEIAPLVGLSVRTVRERISTGRPVHRIGRKNYGRRTMFAGQERKSSEIAEMIGATVGLVNYRIANGIPLDRPVIRQRRTPEAKSLTESGVRHIGSGDHGENGLYWHDDLECRVWHLYCGGDGFGECTLDEIGKLWGLSRERIRQICEQAFAKIRRKADRGDQDALDMLEWLALRSRLRSRQKPDHWEQAEMNSPGYFGLTEFNDTTSYVDIAHAFRDRQYETQKHVRAAYAGKARRGG